MARIVVSEFISLDGVFDEPGTWTMPWWNDDIAAYKKDELFAADAMLLGRVTYEGFAKAWPSMTDEAGFADRMNSLPKHVATSTLDELTWNAQPLRDDITTGVKALQTAYDGDVLVAGSGTLVRELLRQGLVDELRLALYPVLKGGGKRLFGDAEVELSLVRSQQTPTGVTLLTYRA